MRAQILRCAIAPEDQARQHAKHHGDQQYTGNRHRHDRPRDRDLFEASDRRRRHPHNDADQGDSSQQSRHAGR